MKTRLHPRRRPRRPPRSPRAAAARTPSPLPPAARRQNRKALLDFARCMRENGVDMPDPQFERRARDDARRCSGRAIRRRCAPPRRRARSTARRSSRRSSRSPRSRSSSGRRWPTRAACASTGIDMPDPTFDENGGAQMRLGRGIDPGVAEVPAGAGGVPRHAADGPGHDRGRRSDEAPAAGGGGLRRARRRRRRWSRGGDEPDPRGRRRPGAGDGDRRAPRPRRPRGPLRDARLRRRRER